MPIVATLLLALILAIGTALFALQNTTAVTVRVLFWEYQTSLVLIILGSTAIGVALAYILSIGHRWHMAREVRTLKSAANTQAVRIRELEEQLQATRPSPTDPKQKTKTP